MSNRRAKDDAAKLFSFRSIQRGQFPSERKTYRAFPGERKAVDALRANKKQLQSHKIFKAASASIDQHFGGVHTELTFRRSSNQSVAIRPRSCAPGK